MSVGKDHSEQFKRYLNGQMSHEEAHAFEREVLNDPFAQEALEGFEVHGSDSIDDLKKLQGQLFTQKKKPLLFLRIAAIVTLLIVGSFTVYQFTDQIESDQLAMEEESIDEAVQSSPAPDTIPSPSVTKDQEQIAEEVQPTPNEEDLQINVEETEIKEELLLVAEDDISNDEKSEALVLMEDEEIVNEKSFASELQGKGDVLEISQAKIELDEPSTDTIVHEQLVAVNESFFADEAMSTSSPEVENVETRAKKARMGATARSASSTNSQVVAGNILNENGEALPGVTVVIKGTTTGTTTDMDGYFELLNAENQTLVVSYVGFESQEIAVGNRSNINVVMGGATELSEIVVTGNAESNETSYAPAIPSTGNRAFKEYIEENLNYPEEARTNKIEGTVVLQLTIDATSKVADIEIRRSLGYGCDEEAIRLINDGPTWKAAQKDGNAVEDKLKVRVKFKLD